jgi:hypothetical protein
MPAQEIWARLYPWDPALGYVAKRHTVMDIKFLGGDGLNEVPVWYGPLSPRVADVLRKMRQPIGTSPGPNAPPLLQIVTSAEKQQIDAYEAEIRSRWNAGYLADQIFANDGSATIGRVAAALQKEHQALVAQHNPAPTLPESIRDIDPNQGSLTPHRPTVSGAEALKDIPAPPAAPAKPEELSAPGRAAAVEGFEKRPDPVDVALEDAEDAADEDADADEDEDEAVDLMPPIRSLPVAPEQAGPPQADAPPPPPPPEPPAPPAKKTTRRRTKKK